MDPSLLGELIDVEDDQYPLTPAEKKSNFIAGLHWGKLSWQVKAPCWLQKDLFKARNDQQKAVAEKYCTKCDYQVECLTIALAQENNDGVWGGCTERERVILLQKFEHNYPGYNKIWDTETEEQLVQYCSLIVRSRVRSEENT